MSVTVSPLNEFVVEITSVTPRKPIDPQCYSKHTCSPTPPPLPPLSLKVKQIIIIIRYIVGLVSGGSEVGVGGGQINEECRGLAMPNTLEAKSSKLSEELFSPSSAFMPSKSESDGLTGTGVRGAAPPWCRCGDFCYSQNPLPWRCRAPLTQTGRPFTRLTDALRSEVGRSMSVMRS